MKSSGMSGQAVLEGVIMKSKNKCAVAVRKPDNNIEVLSEKINNISDKYNFLKLPFIRGIVSFIEELYFGIKNFSVSGKFYEDDKKHENTEKNTEALQVLIVIAAISLAIGMFFAVPYGLSLVLSRVTDSEAVLILLEGAIRLILLVLYIIGMSMMPDIKRFYMYIGAEHKTMNCIEKGLPLTLSNVRLMSRKNYKCGTGFIFDVIILSIVLFMFIRTDNAALRVAFRCLAIPLIAAVVYEIRGLASGYNNILLKILLLPGTMLQSLIADEPADSMIEVAISAAEAVKDKEEAEKSSEKENNSKGEKVINKTKKAADKDKGIKRVAAKRKNTPAHKEVEQNIKPAGNAADSIDSKQMNENIQGNENNKDNSLKERTKSAVINKDNVKALKPSVEDEDDEILNALNHFFKSKKEEEKNRGKKK